MATTGHEPLRAPAERTPTLPREYLLWLGAAVASFTGNAIMLFSLTWQAASYGPAYASLIMGCVLTPRLVLLLVGGVVGDRLGPRRIMIACDAVLLATCIIFLPLIALAGAGLLTLVAFAIVFGVVDAFYLPSSSSLPRHLVPAQLLPRAVTLRQSGNQVSQMAGPPLAGLLLAAGGLAAVVSFNAVSFAAMLIVLVSLRSVSAPRPPLAGTEPARPAKTAARDIASAFGLLVRYRSIGLFVVLVALTAGALMPIGAVLIPALAGGREWSPADAGFLVGGQAGATLAVSLLLTTTGVMRRTGIAAAAGLALMSAGLLGLMPNESFAVPMGAMILIGFGAGFFIAHCGPLLIQLAPADHLARVQSILAMAQSVAVLVGSAGAGVIATASPALAVGVTAAFTGLCALVATCLPQLRQVTSR